MDKPFNLLLVDDDAEICELLSGLLRKYGYNVFIAYEGAAMFEHLAQTSIDLIILDIRLPGDDGLTLCRKIRARSTIPIIMLTANDDETDCIIGLEIGADDCMAKPFNPRELVARIRAVLRRTQDYRYSLPLPDEEDACVFEFAGWRMDVNARRLISPQHINITLSAGEYALLNLFVNKPRRVLSREQLLALLHDKHHDPFDRSIDIQVSRLRQKLDDNPKDPQIIKTVRGGGYLFAPTIKKVSVAVCV